ncbi:Glycosyl transferases group 1 [Thermoplasmatales archaeon]|nr:Glycosyl transferases group 1 [Thermoplasmatales archaeon]
MLSNFHDLCYVIADVFYDSAHLKILKEIADKFGVSERLIFTGEINKDVKNFLLQLAVFYLLHNHEMFGITTGEAMVQEIAV